VEEGSARHSNLAWLLVCSGCGELHKAQGEAAHSSCPVGLQTGDNLVSALYAKSCCGGQRTSCTTTGCGWGAANQHCSRGRESWTTPRGSPRPRRNGIGQQPGLP